MTAPAASAVVRKNGGGDWETALTETWADRKIRRATERAAVEAAPPAPSRTNPALRPVAPIHDGKTHKLKRQPLPPPPRIAWLRLDQLAVDETYQRSISRRGAALIRNLVEGWDWNRFKPLSVADLGSGVYEVVDGQHTAIAAATHGAIDSLPCLILIAPDIATRAADFVGINRQRTGLTPFALFRAAVVAGDPAAVAVSQALAATGATLIESIRNNRDIGATASATLLMSIAGRKGRVRVERCLRAAIAAGLAPISSATLRLLDANAATCDDAQLAELARLGRATP